MKALPLILPSLLFSLSVLSQGISIQVNPDGTHSVIHHHGATSTRVNSNGTHSIIHHHGNTSTQVNPDGTHSVIHHHGNTSTQINSDGTHTIIHHQGSASTQVNPNGTHSVIHNHGGTSKPSSSEEKNSSISPKKKYKAGRLWFKAKDSSRKSSDKRARRVKKNKPVNNSR